MKNDTLISETDGWVIMQPHVKHFIDAYKFAFANLQRYFAEFPGGKYKRTICVNIHQWTMEHIREKFSDREHESIELIEEYETIKLIFEKKVFVRLKKVDEYGFSSNVQTSLNDLFVSQDISEQTELEFKDVPRMTVLEFGYHPGLGWSDIAFVKLICRKDDMIVWSKDVPLDGSDDVSVISPIYPIAPNNGDGGDDLIVIPKKTGSNDTN